MSPAHLEQGGLDIVQVGQSTIAAAPPDQSLLTPAMIRLEPIDRDCRRNHHDIAVPFGKDVAEEVVATDDAVDHARETADKIAAGRYPDGVVDIEQTRSARKALERDQRGHHLPLQQRDVELPRADRMHRALREHADSPRRPQYAQLR